MRDAALARALQAEQEAADARARDALARVTRERKAATEAFSVDAPRPQRWRR